jgi:aspartyl-tRNA(Asn)/glutamyl-tRNA(Gln) amidotransferase subunit C
VFRSDVVEPCLTQEQALAEAPKSAEGRFAVPRILGEAE